MPASSVEVGPVLVLRAMGLLLAITAALYVLWLATKR